MLQIGDELVMGKVGFYLFREFSVQVAFFSRVTQLIILFPGKGTADVFHHPDAENGKKQAEHGDADTDTFEYAEDLVGHGDAS